MTRVEAAAAARESFLDRAGADSLHDLRVALRRLRATLGAYRPFLRAGGVRPKRLARRVAAVARATGRARDLDVQLLWLERKERTELDDREEAGVRWFRDDLEARRREAYQAARRRVARDLPALEQRIRRRMKEYRVRVQPERPVGDVTFRDSLEHLLSRLLGELTTALDGIGSPSQREQAHRARIIGKRVRYLLEPVAGELSSGKDFIKRLKVLQDDLGELNDAQVLGEEVAVAFEAISSEAHRMEQTRPAATARDPAPGLIALARLLHFRKQDAYRRLEADWLREGGRAWREASAGILAELGRDRALPVETERKYLLSGMPPGSDAWTVLHIEQGYLPGERIVERLRRVRGPDGVRYFRTVKLGAGVSRIEIEEEMEQALFDELWSLTSGRRVAKRRYRAPDGALMWEIDRFLDRDLVLAEVELPNPDRPVLPDWLRPVLIREVTDDPAFTNRSLAR